MYETPDSEAVELTIDYAKYYATKIDRIDEVQNDITQMDKWSDDAAKQLKIQVETSFFSGVFGTATARASSCSTSNVGSSTNGMGGLVSGGYFLGYDDATYKMKVIAGATTAGATSTSNGTTGNAYAISAVDVIMGMSSVLTEQNVPETERWCVIPQWMAYQLQTGDLRRADSLGGPDNQDVIRKGKIGMLGNMTIYVSNNLPKAVTSTECHLIPFGHKMALTFATQLIENELLPHPLAFGKIMRGLQVYGFKSIKPAAVGCAIGYKG